MRKDAFINTYSVTTLRAIVAQALEAGQGQPAMVAATGDAGTGKTWASRALYAELGGVYLRVLEGMTQNAFLQEICFELMGERPHGSARCKNVLLKKLRNKPEPIFIDEAERLHGSRLEDLRDIHDITGSPVILTGEPALLVKLSARDRLNDRIPEAFRVVFGEISQRDIMLYALEAGNLTLSPEAAALVHTTTKGNFRRIYNTVLLLERAAAAVETQEISAQFCRDALGITQIGGR